ncbi:MAG: VOC family protein [Rhodospirillales bacterium]
MSDREALVPAGFGEVTPLLIVDGADAAIRFYGRVFEAVELMRVPAADGHRLVHAAIQIGGGAVMLADAFPEHGSRSPLALGGSPVPIHLYVADVDAVFARAAAEGAMVVMPVATMAWGDRCGRFVDPFGHHWSIATRLVPAAVDRMLASVQAFANLLR